MLKHRLREIKVVLIRTLISDQLAYVNIAKDWFTIADLREIRQRKIGGGKIGGKAAGMLLAQRILDEVASEEIRQHLHHPRILLPRRGCHLPVHGAQRPDALE